MCTGMWAVQCTVGAHRVYVHSVSWIRHLGMACGEMFVVRCSHNLPATAELPFANRPGDRTDRFRSTCRSSLLVLLTIYCFMSLAFREILPRTNEDIHTCVFAHECVLGCTNCLTVYITVSQQVITTSERYQAICVRPSAVYQRSNVSEVSFVCPYMLTCLLVFIDMYACMSNQYIGALVTG